MPPHAFAAYQKQERRISILRPLVHHIGAHCLKRGRLMKINDTFGSRLAANAPRMIVTHPNGHTTLAISNILEMQAQHFTRPKAAVEHEPDHRKIAAALQLGNHGIHLLICQRARQAMNLPRPQRAAGHRLRRHAA